VILKLDIKLRTPIPTSPPSINTDPWVSQTLRNPTDALSQIILVRDRIACYQGNSLTSVFAIIAALAKGTEILAYKNIFLAAEIRIFRKANKAFSKRRRAKKESYLSRKYTCCRGYTRYFGPGGGGRVDSTR
jgi:hypothetical protein